MKLMEYLPWYYQENEKMRILQETIEIAVKKYEDKQKEMIDNCFIQTATTLLSRYETILQLDISSEKENEFRRERLKAKVRGRGATTKQLIQEVAKSFSNGEVEVIEDNKNSCFFVKFVGTLGVPANIKDLQITIEEIKPAHLSFEFIYTYNTWNNLERLTWEQAIAHTWEEIRTVRIE